MNKQDFNTLLDRRLNLTREVLESKSKEYSTDSDKLHNFKQTAITEQITPADAAHWFLTKHMTSYRDMLKGAREGKKYSQKMIDEKFGDIINYFILQEAIFAELYCEDAEFGISY